jgi:fatty acid desaturase
MPRIDVETVKAHQQESFQSLLYRYFFFQWLFFDMTRARGPIERRATWLHNQRQREWLPAYMRRWAMLSTVDFALGAIGERAFAAPMFAACWYTGSCMCVSVLIIIAVVWIFLGRNQPL